MTTAEAAAALGISVTALYDRIRTGKVKAERFGARVLMVPVEEVERWQQLGKLRPGPKPKEPSAEELRREQADHQDVLERGRRRIRSEQSDT